MYNKQLERNETASNIEYSEQPEGSLKLSIRIPSSVNLKLPEHHYCFDIGPHSGKFYLKIGAAGRII